MIKARVHKSDRREFICKILETGEVVTAKALANLLKDAEIVVGDFVFLNQEKNEYVIVELEDRKNEIFRMLVREKKKKVTASNVDFMVIFSSLSKPAYKRGLIDRYLVRAFQWGIRPMVVLNKLDAINEKKVDLNFEVRRLENAGVMVFAISALEKKLKAKEDIPGFSELKSTLHEKTAVFLGQSGVGKSKTITALTDGKIELLSKEVGKVGKGAHTTTWSEIVESDNLTLIDSPGIRSYSLEDIEPDDLIHLFPDLFELARYCEFADCRHEDYSKGCRFHQLKDTDPLKDIIYSRLESFKKIYSEIKAIPDYERK